MRRALRFFDLMAVVLVAWGIMAVVPLEWFWFDPGHVVVGNGTKAQVPAIQFDRVIKRNTLMRYQVTIRNVDSGHIVCDPASQPFTYRSDAVLPESIQLHEYWTGGDDRCWPLPHGTYVMETCWTATNVFWGITGPKTACRLSNPFMISDGASS